MIIVLLKNGVVYFFVRLFLAQMHDVMLKSNLCKSYFSAAELHMADIVSQSHTLRVQTLSTALHCIDALSRLWSSENEANPEVAQNTVNPP